MGTATKRLLSPPESAGGLRPSGAVISGISRISIFAKEGESAIKAPPASIPSVVSPAGGGTLSKPGCGFIITRKGCRGSHSSDAVLRTRTAFGGGVRFCVIANPARISHGPRPGYLPSPARAPLR